MLGKGMMTPEMMMGAQSKLEEAIEDLRVKYEKIAEQEAIEAEKKAAAERAKNWDETKEAAAAEAARVDMTMEDPEVERMRQARLAALRTAQKSRQQHVHDGHGELREIVEDEFLKEVTSTQLVVMHFYHEEFITCKVMDKHLRALAPKVLAAKFLKIDAQKASFFIGKLKIKVLPSLMFFKDGVAVGRQTGFEGLVSAATDQDFPTNRLLRVLRVHGMLGNQAKEGADDYDDDDDDEGDGAGSGSAVGDFEARMARARRAMLEALDDDD